LFTPSPPVSLEANSLFSVTYRDDYALDTETEF
jgi:hypothetical protein